MHGHMNVKFARSLAMTLSNDLSYHWTLEG